MSRRQTLLYKPQKWFCQWFALDTLTLIRKSLPRKCNRSTNLFAKEHQYYGLLSSGHNSHNIKTFQTQKFSNPRNHEIKTMCSFNHLTANKSFVTKNHTTICIGGFPNPSLFQIFFN